MADLGKPPTTTTASSGILFALSIYQYLDVLLEVGVAHRLAFRFGWPTLIHPDIIGVAVGFSALVGVGFGLYPALKASRLDPIAALQFE